MTLLSTGCSWVEPEGELWNLGEAGVGREKPEEELWNLVEAGVGREKPEKELWNLVEAGVGSKCVDWKPLGLRLVLLLREDSCLTGSALANWLVVGKVLAFGSSALCWKNSCWLDWKLLCLPLKPLL